MITVTEYAFSENINDEKFLLLEGINTSKNKELPYYGYVYFELDNLGMMHA